MFFLFWLPLGPDFGSSPELIRKKLLDILNESGKTTCIVDNMNMVKRYASQTSSSVPVSSDDEALSKAMKEVNKLPCKNHQSMPLSSSRCHIHTCVCVCVSSR